VYAADGGYHHAEKLNIPVDVVIGDLDSVRGTPPCKCVKHPRDKDQSDLELAIDHALQDGATEINIIGALGGRFDHALANVYLLKNYINHTVRIVTESQTVRALPPGTYTLHGAPDMTLSLLPLGGPVSQVTLKGCQFPLTNEDLTSSEIRGISNRFTSKQATLSFTQGALLVTKTGNLPIIV
jgi:thiamine pyrophosphokinase